MQTNNLPLIDIVPRFSYQVLNLCINNPNIQNMYIIFIFQVWFVASMTIVISHDKCVDFYNNCLEKYIY